MPGWYDDIQADLDAGRISAVGVVQEQHGERARLFNQWKQLSMDLYVDSLNNLNCTAVPFVFLVDSQRIVRFKNPTREQYREFVAEHQNQQPAPQPAVVASDQETDHGNRSMLAGELNEAIDYYTKRIAQNPSDARAHFRLGVVYRKRYDSGGGQETDFQRAIGHWRQALALDPNQYIWRRRIQQYGPVLDKPYPFYNWIETARNEIRMRGETPISLSVEPQGAELVSPQSIPAAAGPAENPDPSDKLQRDERPVIRITPVVVAATTDSPRAVRVHMVLTPDPVAQTAWNNEAEPAQVWFHSHESLEFNKPLHNLPQPAEATSMERRTLDLEVRWDQSLVEPPPLKGFAIYSICDKATGVCRLFRQDFTVELSPDSE